MIKDDSEYTRVDYSHSAVHQGLLISLSTFLVLLMISVALLNKGCENSLVSTPVIIDDVSPVVAPVDEIPNRRLRVEDINLK